ncbi:MAG: TMEM175 family protein [Aestuariibacter sp.]
MSRLRGETMNRIETFVAAAFAFAVTMLVISVDSIPGTFSELQQAAMDIPAFAASFAIITWIWFEHATWCRKFGLEQPFGILELCLNFFSTCLYLSSTPDDAGVVWLY